MAWSAVGPAASFAEGSRRLVDVGGVRIVVLRVGGVLHAFENVCPHRGGPVGEGALEGPLLTCPRHEWSFDVRTGAHVRNPGVRLARWAVRVTEGVVEVEAGSVDPGPMV